MSRIAALALLIATGCADSSVRLFEAAGRAMARDDFDQAAHLYQEVTIQAPDTVVSARAHFELAQIYYLRRRNSSAARDSLLEALRSPGVTVERDAKIMLARLYANDLGEPGTAIELYESLLEDELDEETRRTLLLSLADGYYRHGELDASASAYRDALALPYHPDTDQAYMRLANLEWLSGSADESLRLVRQLAFLTTDVDRRRDAIVMEVENLILLDRLGEAERRLEDVERSDDLLEKLVSLQRRIDGARGVDGGLGPENVGLQEQQKKIRWGAGRRRRASGGQ